MKFFDRFKKNKDSGLPDKYKGIITPEDYQFALGIAKKYHAENGLKILRIDQGEIVAEVNGEEQHRFLDNLVRHLSAYEKKDWAAAIYEHFDKFKDHRRAFKYLYKDYEYAAQFLRVLIKDAGLYGDEQHRMVCRCDFPGTTTFLVIEYEEQFAYVTRKDSVDWDKSDDELFVAAISNTPVEEVRVRKHQYCDKFPTYVFLSGDYSASLMLDLPFRLPVAFGTYGSMIAIPTKGTAFAHPIETADLMELVETLTPMIIKLYNEDPGNITTDFFWRYGDHVEKFPTGEDENGPYIRLPEDLLTLFKG